MRSTRELAERIGNPAVSHSVIRNIESGRKADLSIVHLLEIAMALEVTPLVLILDFARPYGPVGIPGLGPAFAGWTALEFDRWVTAPSIEEEYSEPEHVPDEMFRLVIARELAASSWLQSTRREAIQSALEMTRKYDAPHDFTHLRRGNWEVDRSLDHLLSAAEEFGMELSEPPAAAEPEGTDFARYFGRRVRTLRRTEGFRSARELAEEISNPLVSESVIRNIESGRKADVSLVHVLEISQALDVSPIALLFDYRRPFQPVPPPGLGATFAGKSPSELVTWFSQPNNLFQFEDADYRETPLHVKQLSAARNVDHWLRLRERLNLEEQSGNATRPEDPERGTQVERKAARLSTEVTLEWVLHDAHELGIELR